jgi:hypothetical protein
MANYWDIVNSPFTSLSLKVVSGYRSTNTLVWGDFDKNVMTETAFSGIYVANDMTTKNARYLIVYRLTAANLNIVLPPGILYLVQKTTSIFPTNPNFIINPLVRPLVSDGTTIDNGNPSNRIPVTFRQYVATSEPSPEPSSLPTGVPSTEPSGQPSRQPTGQPTDQPTVQPTGAPTQNPNGQPTGQPSGQPTGQPTEAWCVDIGLYDAFGDGWGEDAVLRIFNSKDNSVCQEVSNPDKAFVETTLCLNPALKLRAEITCDSCTLLEPWEMFYSISESKGKKAKSHMGTYNTIMSLQYNDISNGIRSTSRTIALCAQTSARNATPTRSST